jgi:hypothetical protein
MSPALPADHFGNTTTIVHGTMPSQLVVALSQTAHPTNHGTTLSQLVQATLSGTATPIVHGTMPLLSDPAALY